MAVPITAALTTARQAIGVGRRQAITRYQSWKPAVDHLEAAGYDFGRLEAILITIRTGP
jgi:hypothetical protein